MRKYLIIILAPLLWASCRSSESLSAEEKSHNGEIEVLKLSQSEEMQFTSYFFDGNREKILGNSENAVKLFEKALEINPNSHAVLFELSKINAEKNNIAAATNYAQKAYNLNKENIWYATLLSQLYAENDNFDGAVNIFKNIIAENPTKYEYYFELASIYTAQGEYESALELYDKIEAQTGLNEEVAAQKQILYIEQKQYDKALAEIQKLINLNPDDIRYYGMLAEIYEKQGDNAKAYETYLEMKDMEPENGLVHLSLAEYYRKQNDIAKTNEALQRAFEGQDLSIDVKVNILLSYLSNPAYKDHLPTAEKLATTLEEIHPDNAKSFAIHGDILMSLQKYKEAREKFRQAVALDPNRAPIWQQILTLDSQLNDFEALADESDEAIQLFPSEPMFYLFNGIALIQKNNLAEAIDILNAGKNLVLGNNESLAQFYASLGDAYHANNQTEKSDQAYEKSLEYNPSNVIVLNNYSYYLSIRGEKLDKAEKMAKKANDLSPNVASFQDTYAWVLYKRDNFQNALFWINEAIKNGGDTDPTVHEHKGDVLLKLGRPEEAIKSWEMAIKLGGNGDSLNDKIANANVKK